jgi:alpha-L-arabinofuranosidase
LLVGTGPAALAQAPATLKIDLARPGTPIPPQFFGLMTEEINHAYDGGLFAELIQNRTFQDPAPEREGEGARRSRAPIHWFPVGEAKLSSTTDEPVNTALPISLRVTFGPGGESGVANDGYWGIPVRPSTTYTASFYAKASDGFAGPVTASIRTDDGNVTVATANSAPIAGTWAKYTVTLATGPNAPTTSNARFVLSATGPGSMTFSLVSLFPPTYQNVVNGLRPDLMELMAQLRPQFIRLPGGNYLEGNRFADRFAWKQMIGPADTRPGHMGCWGYRSSDGFGLPEFLLWCKQLGAEPVLGVFAGYTLNGDHFKAGTPEMALYTQEALEEIEYIAGPADSEWGRKRAADGFPEPFPLRYVEIGNEDWFDRSGSYDGRFTQIATAIRQRYPHLKLIASAPVKSFKPDLYDDHFYRSANQLFSMATQYDPRPADAPPIRFSGGGWNGRQSDPSIATFVGEWATQEGRPTPTLNAALADAAFTMGLEKNADAVPMQCYAPLLVNVNPADPARGYPRAWQWNTNLIGYDALHSFGSPSFYAQALLAQNKGDVVLPVTLDLSAVPPAVAEGPRGKVGLGSWQTDVEYTGLTVTAPDGRVLLSPEQAAEPARWQFPGTPWRVEGGTIRPGDKEGETWGFVGDPAWTDYTVRVRARKLGGLEGFLVLWHAPSTSSYYWWNIGGWGNTSTRFQDMTEANGDSYGPSSDFTVETGRWYDLRVEVQGRHVRAYIDDKLVTEATSEPRTIPARAFATATLDSSAGEVVVKVVNFGASALATDLSLQGAGQVEPTATAHVLSGEPGDVNSIDEPRRIVPRKETISGVGSSFQHTFPPHSLTVLRLKTTAP